MEETLTVPEAAARLGVCEQTVRRAIWENRIESFGPSFGQPRVRIPVTEIERIERERRERKPARRVKKGGE